MSWCNSVIEMFDCKEISGVFNKLMASGNKDLLLFGGIFRKLDIIGSEDTSKLIHSLLFFNL